MTHRISSLVIALAVGLAGFAQADVVVEYGDFDGDFVNFLNVTESNGGDNPLYGAPTVMGNSLNFLPTGFESQSEDGDLDFLDGRLSFTIEAKDGASFSEVKISEFGAYFDAGATSLSQINMIAFVQTSDGLFNGTFSFTNVGDGFGAWEGELTITFPETTTATFVMDNQLFTNSDMDGVAFIDKKGIKIEVVPEPTTLGLLALAGVGLISRRRR